MPILEAWVGSTLASVIGMAGSVAGTAIGTAAFKDWFDGCRKRTTAGRIRPGNHDLVRGIRTAHLAAVKAVAGAQETLLTAMAAEHLSADETAFANRLTHFLDDRLKTRTAKSIDHDVLTVDDVDHALGQLAYPGSVEGFSAHEQTEKNRADDRALAELARDAGFPVPPLFESIFRGQRGTGWHDIFSLYLSEEIKTNPRFQAIFFTAQFVDTRRLIEALDARVARLLALEPQLADFMDDVRHALRRIDERLEEIYAAVRPKGICALTWPPLPKPDPRSFGYRHAADVLRGRDADFEAVEGLLLDTPAATEDPLRQLFRWHGVFGGAGAGKSRFAMELLQNNRFHWPASGFVQKFAVDAEHAAQWPVDDPTLLVVDYAGAKAKADVIGFVSTFAERANAGQLKAPVRLLLIERRRNEEVFQELMQDQFESSRVGIQITRPPELHELSRLTEVELVDLMQARIGNAANAPQPGELMSLLDDFDPQRRPLFAAIVADAIRDDALPKITGAGSGEANRLKLFGGLIQRERSQWKERLRAEDLPEHAVKQIVDQHETLAGLATLVRGLDEAAYRQLIEEGRCSNRAGRHYVPHPDEQIGGWCGVRPDLYAAITGAGEVAGPQQAYAAVEPDLIGERLVIDLLNAPGGGDRRAWLLDTAWRLAPWNAAVFCRLCYQDYAETTAGLGYLMGAVEDAGIAARSALLRALAAEMADQTGASRRPEEAQLKRIFALLPMVDARMRDACRRDADVTRNVAALWQQVANFAGRAVTEHLDFQAVGLDPALDARTDAPRRVRYEFGRASDRRSGA